MANGNHLLGIDIGTGGCKALLIDEAGNVIATATIIKGADWRRRFRRLLLVRKASVDAEKPTTQTIRKTAMLDTCAFWAKNSVSPTFLFLLRV